MSQLTLITGASSSIGRAFARRFAAQGCNLILTGRDAAALTALAQEFDNVAVDCIAADLSTDQDIAKLADICGNRPLATLINCAGVSHYMPFEQLSAEKAGELIRIKQLAPTLMTLAAVPGMLARGRGRVVNVAGMIAFSGPCGPEVLPRRAVYTGTLAYLLAWTQQLHAEYATHGLNFQVLCPGVVNTAFHSRQGMDLSHITRMSAEDVVRASEKGFALGETVCAPGVEQADLLHSVFAADLAAFAGQSPQLATRYL